MMKDEWGKELNSLFMTAKGSHETRILLQSLLTPQEYEGVAKRWQIVKALIEGRTQRFIRDKFKVAVATVTRGSRELSYGDGTFQKFYKRLYPGKIKS